MIAMSSMELDDESKLDAPMPIEMASKPDYPYGLRICLCNSEIEKLGIDPTDATVGGTFMMQAIARVTSVSCDDRGGEKCYRIEAQIEELGVLGSDEADGSESLAA
jgi:hypothetical protein